MRSKTKNTVGANGIRPVRQGISDRFCVIHFARSMLFDRDLFVRDSIDRFLMPFFNDFAKWVKALANRVNAIDPYGIFRYPKHLCTIGIISNC